MDYNFLVDVELDRVDWAQVHEASGSAVNIPAAFRELLAGTTADEVKRAYWRLENHIVVQGYLYEASLYVVPAICASLVDPNRSRLVRTWAVELLFQICDGYPPTASDVSAGIPADIVDRCRSLARNALWILYGELAKQEIKVVERLIKVLENDPDRLSHMIRRIPSYKPPVWTIGRST